MPSSRPALAAALAILPSMLPAQSLPPLRDVPVVTEGLIEVALAYEIDRVCDDLDGRRIQGIAFLWSLHNSARDLGYSRQEIEAFIDDDVEKDRLEGIARERLAALGAVEGQPETYCAVGRDLMARETPAGSLLSD